MKKWACNVCGYVYDETQGDPDHGIAPGTKFEDIPVDWVCPICGVGREEFSLQEDAPPKTAPPKRWKCIVCDYIHTGDEPPDICPVCGEGKDKFILLVDEIVELTAEAIASAGEGTINSALDAVTYGLYVVSSFNDGKINAQIANSVFQLTSKPPQIAACLNKRNLTTEYVLASQRFAVSILSQDQCDTVKVFGYQSGRNADKFANVKYVPGQNGCPILTDCLGYLEAEVIPEKTIDVGTHIMFVAKVTSGRLATKREAMTYSFYRNKK